MKVTLAGLESFLHDIDGLVSTNLHETRATTPSPSDAKHGKKRGDVEKASLQPPDTWRGKRRVSLAVMLIVAMTSSAMVVMKLAGLEVAMALGTASTLLSLVILMALGLVI